MRWVMNIASLESADGGPSNAVARIAAELATTGDDVTVVFLERQPSNRHVASVESGKAGVALLPVQVRRFSRFRFSARQLAIVTRQCKSADAVSTHGFYQFTCIAAYLAARMHRLPLFVQPHGVFEPYQERTSVLPKRVFMSLIGNRILRYASAVLVASDQEVRGVRSSTRADPDKIRLIPLGQSFTLNTALQRPVLSDDGRQVIFLSRIAPKKRLDLLIEACRLKAATADRFSVAVCGSGDEGFEAKMRKMASGLPISFYGHVTGEERNRIEGESAIFCLPSDNENYGQAVTEAMQRGLPVITTNTTGASGHVVKGHAGWVLSEPTAEQLAACITDALSDRQRLIQVGQAGVAYAATMNTWSDVAEAWRALASEL